MPQAEFIPLEYKLVEQNGYTADNPPVSTEVNLRSSNSDTPFLFTFQAIRPGLFRTTFSSSKHPLPPHPSAARPEVDFGDLNPTSQISKKGTLQTINVGDVTATVDWEATPVVTISLPGQKTPLFTDLPFRSYTADGNGIAHYSRYKREILHVGLGEKAAPMNLSNRSFTLSMTDCFGYDVYRSDPLYKQIPLLISASPEGVVGTFSTSHSRGMYSVGAEIDGMWGHFKVYRQDFGGLEEYTIIGKTIKEVVKLYADLVGYPKLVPRWAFGYIAGGYRYAALDEPRACDALMDFSDKLLKYDIPCSAMQMSSGYTIAETVPKNRHVFTWNHHRFPDPEKFLTDYRARGIRLIANVKPYVLATHPEYKKLVAADAFFKDPVTGKAGETRLWSAGGGESDIGSHIDFTSKGGFQWWYDGVKSLRKAGIEGIWNDNNEYTIPNDHWQCACDSDPETGTIAERVGKDVGIWGRSVNTELMGKSSHDALVEAEPEERPFVLTRAATAGTMRYAASSWSGDNVTSWPGMKGANSLSLNAGMSLLQCYGHDIGGFEGPQPTPELLLRWVQLGVHSSRFAINCFKTDKNDNTVGGVIEPWMYPEIIPNIREIIKRRYELMPYVYSLALESHLTANPPQKWTGFGYESDPEVWTEEVMSGEEQFWLGDTLLVGGVYKKGSSVASMYLPTSGADDEGYLNINAPHQYISAGKWVDIESPWNDSIPLLARVGGAVPVGKGVQTRAPGAKNEIATHLPEDDYRGIEIFPPSGSSGSKSFSTTWYEDDGISANPKISSFTITYSSTESEVVAKLESASSNEYKPVWSDFSIILPFGDKRTVVSGSADSTFVKTDESRGRSVFKSQKA